VHVLREALLCIDMFISLETSDFRMRVVVFLGIVVSRKGVEEDTVYPTLGWDVFHLETDHPPFLKVPEVLVARLIRHHVHSQPFRMAELAPAHREIREVDCVDVYRYGRVIP
jgi:hypothetical protein